MSVLGVCQWEASLSCSPPGATICLHTCLQLGLVTTDKHQIPQPDKCYCMEILTRTITTDEYRLEFRVTYRSTTMSGLTRT
ncbi:hypothetical protein PoB_002637500 [Plakobranchus ocellatus]|uniref:Uncharacterized protein n=1 Tax=Plakobranchus ocellatus TaxID=259542 RepID=A0AAV3ZXE9_9GAST|nr:hypothetical protein PoB_002637500 [Plakobranchus ocellatus]